MLCLNENLPIRLDIVFAYLLINPNHFKDFFIYTNSSEETISTIILQKDIEKNLDQLPL
jgi:uncharacterized protein (DUF39 family)